MRPTTYREQPACVNCKNVLIMGEDYVCDLLPPGKKWWIDDRVAPEGICNEYSPSERPAPGDTTNKLANEK